MYRINIQPKTNSGGLVQANVCVDSLVEVEVMLGELMRRHLGVEHPIVLPLGHNVYMVYEISGPIAEVCIEKTVSGSG